MDQSASNQTPDEQKNIDIVTEYMKITYDPKRANAQAVAHLCAKNNRFIAPTTFPGVNTLEEYAEEHEKIMQEVNDLHFIKFHVLFAKDDRVCLRYSAEGTHGGKPHGNIPPSGKKAQWTASAIFKVENGKIVEFIKDWNKLSMWEQLGWPIEECLILKNAS